MGTRPNQSKAGSLRHTYYKYTYTNKQLIDKIVYTGDTGLLLETGPDWGL